MKEYIWLQRTDTVREGGGFYLKIIFSIFMKVTDISWNVIWYFFLYKNSKADQAFEIYWIYVIVITVNKNIPKFIDTIDLRKILYCSRYDIVVRSFIYRIFVYKIPIKLYKYVENGGPSKYSVNKRSLEKETAFETSVAFTS